MTSAASFISFSVRSLSPMMLKTTPFAFVRGASRRGLEIAPTAASFARSFPLPVPTPMMPLPAFCITARTSAKSTFTNPGLMMISEIPMTPWRKISSAYKNASCTGVFSGTMSKSLSLLITIRVSTESWSALMASDACIARRRPSKPKGLVTTATVSAPVLLEISATMGAAPDPVPPPMPAVTNTKSASLITSSTWRALSSAALRPTIGSPPAPSPLVTISPMAKVWG
mmetsp:Transcript_6368/g.8647  ORF Transcript_6368/g.8647 Transcript_6368/m.8647 type:complete len:228 (+) Transcript_6368:751-1434(+)